jgi:hypothetical protein
MASQTRELILPKVLEGHKICLIKCLAGTLGDNKYNFWKEEQFPEEHRNQPLSNYPSTILFFCVSHSSHALLAIFVHATRYAILLSSLHLMSIMLYSGFIHSVECCISSGISSEGVRTSDSQYSAFEDSKMNWPCICFLPLNACNGTLMDPISLPDCRLTVAKSWHAVKIPMDSKRVEAFQSRQPWIRLPQCFGN